MEKPFAWIVFVYVCETGRKTAERLEYWGKGHEISQVGEIVLCGLYYHPTTLQSIHSYRSSHSFNMFTITISLCFNRVLDTLQLCYIPTGHQSTNQSTHYVKHCVYNWVHPTFFTSSFSFSDSFPFSSISIIFTGLGSKGSGIKEDVTQFTCILNQIVRDSSSCKMQNTSTCWRSILFFLFDPIDPIQSRDPSPILENNFLWCNNLSTFQLFKRVDASFLAGALRCGGKNH